jgi:putative AlgH/UPF0301 family transcriptional regulator
MLRLAAVLVYILAFPALAPTQSRRSQDLAVGKILVASRDLEDPNFAQTVVLLVHYDNVGVVGLVVNRRSRIPIWRALEDLQGAKSRPDSIYVGGPVGRTNVLALVRSGEKVNNAEHIFGEVYLVTKAEALSKTIQSEAPAASLRVYAGYAGWTPDQLKTEVELGAWFIFPGDAGTVFTANPGAIWTRMIEKTETRVALPPHQPLRMESVSAIYPSLLCALKETPTRLNQHPHKTPHTGPVDGCFRRTVRLVNV